MPTGESRRAAQSMSADFGVPIIAAGTVFLLSALILDVALRLAVRRPSLRVLQRREVFEFVCSGLGLGYFLLIFTSSSGGLLWLTGFVPLPLFLVLGLLTRRELSRATRFAA